MGPILKCPLTDEQELIEKNREVAQLAATDPQVVVGIGVLSCNTQVDRVLLVKNTCMKEFTKK